MKNTALTPEQLKQVVAAQSANLKSLPNVPQAMIDKLNKMTPLQVSHINKQLAAATMGNSNTYGVEGSSSNAMTGGAAMGQTFGTVPARHHQ